MFKNANSTVDEDIADELDDLDDEDTFEDTLTGDDFGFILDDEGNLKSVFFPVEGDIPRKIFDILKVCGIKNAEEIYGRTSVTIH